jgi:hypothetical protein
MIMNANVKQAKKEPKNGGHDGENGPGPNPGPPGTK